MAVAVATLMAAQNLSPQKPLALLMFGIGNASVEAS